MQWKSLELKRGVFNESKGGDKENWERSEEQDLKLFFKDI